MSRLVYCIPLILGLFAAEHPCRAAEPADASFASRVAAAQALQEQELYDLAATEWRAIIAAKPGPKILARAQYNLGLCLFQQDDWPAARTAFESVAKGGEPSLTTSALVNLGIVEFTASQSAKDETPGLERALTALDAALKQKPTEPQAAEARLYRGEVLAARNEWAAAAREFQQSAGVKDFRQADRAQDRAAFCYFQLKDYTNATAAYLELVKKFPKSSYAANASLAAGKCCLLNNDLPGAEQQLSAAWEGQGSAEAAHWLAQCYLKQQEPKSALKLVEEALAKKPAPNWRTELRFDRAEALSNDPQTHREAAEELASLASESQDSGASTWAATRAAQLMLSSGNAGRAKELAQQALAKKPAAELTAELQRTLAESEYTLAVEAYQQGRYADVLRTQQQLPDSAGEARWLQLTAACHKQQKNWAAAAKTLEKLIAQHGQEKSVDQWLYNLADVQTESGDSAAAIKTYERLTTAAPSSPLVGEAWLRIGEARLAAKQTPEAIEALRKAGDAAGATAAIRERACHQLAWLEFEQKNLAGTISAIDQQLSAAPNGPLANRAKLLRGEALFAQQKYADALKAYQQADLQQQPELAALILLHQGQAQAQLKQWEASAATLSQARNKFPDASQSAEIRYELGWALQNLGRTEAAAQAYSEVAAGPPSPLAARAQFMLGEMQFAAKEYDEAVRTFFAVAYGYGGREAPADYHAWQAESLFEAARCLDQLGKPGAAAKLCRECVERFPESPKTKHAERWLAAHPGL